MSTSSEIPKTPVEMAEMSTSSVLLKMATDPTRPVDANLSSIQLKQRKVNDENNRKWAEDSAYHIAQLERRQL